MGYLSKLQVIQRRKGQKQFYLICPAPLAQALEMEKGETLEWIVEDKRTLTVRRIGKKEASQRKGAYGQK
jgi:bifunctional DNA-binding transcriptional regulator/antitoxin component of YhaV-PrlF toxin-antitoxin module